MMEVSRGAIHLFLATVLVSVVAGAQNTRSPAIATFTDDGTRIRSDGGGTYDDAETCVVSWVDKKGFFILRTAESSCTPSDPDRALVLDLSHAVVRTPDGSGSDVCHVDDGFGQTGELDICGPNTLTDVRVIAEKLFSSGSSTPVTVPFQLATSFRNTAFELAFEQPVPKDGSGSMRTLTADSGAIAELYKYRPKGPKISIGRFYMPFSVTVSK